MKDYLQLGIENLVLLQKYVVPLWAILTSSTSIYKRGYAFSYVPYVLKCISVDNPIPHKEISVQDLQPKSTNITIINVFSKKIYG